MNKQLKEKTLLLLLILVANTACATHHPRVDQDLKIYDQQIEKLNKNFSKIPKDQNSIEWVKHKLNHMFEADQYMRSYWNTPVDKNYSSEEKNRFNVEFLKRHNHLDHQNTADIKILLQQHEWFKISLFGEKADNQGWLIVQHADLDIEFQKEVLGRLEKLYPLKETKPLNYAYLFDRVASSFNNPELKRPQRYGTQGRCVGPGKWEPWPIEDEAHVDQRRKSVGLSSMSEYKSVFKNICR